MTAIRPGTPALRVTPKAAVRPAAATPAPVAAPAVRKPAPTPAQAKIAELPTRTLVGGAAGGLAGGVTGYLFGSVLAAGGLSGALPLLIGAGGAALMARGGAVIADAIAGKAQKPTWGQGIAGAVGGTVLGAGVWGITAFAGGMAMTPWVFAAAIPMGIAAAVLGGTAIGSFLPGRK